MNMHQVNLNMLSGTELVRAQSRREAAIKQVFMAHVARVRTARALYVQVEEPQWRRHVKVDGESASSTYIFHDNGLTPLLIGTVLREENLLLLVIVDRSGTTPVVMEERFDLRDFVWSAGTLLAP